MKQKKFNVSFKHCISHELLSLSSHVIVDSFILLLSTTFPLTDCGAKAALGDQVEYNI